MASVLRKRLAEIAAIADDDIDTSEIPEADEAWFKGAKLVRPQGTEATAGPVDDMETPRSAVTELDAASQPRRVS